MTKYDKIEAEFQEQLAELRLKLSQKSRNWLIALGVAVVLVIVLLFTLFKPKKDDGKLDGLQREVEALKRNNALLDSMMKYREEEKKENRKTETRIKTRYEQIPSTVTDLDREALRREVTKF